MTITTKLDIGDVADFQRDGKSARIIVGEIRIRTMDHHFDGQPKLLTEYRSVDKRDSGFRDLGMVDVYGKWWPEAYLKP